MSKLCKTTLPLSYTILYIFNTIFAKQSIHREVLKHLHVELEQNTNFYGRFL